MNGNLSSSEIDLDLDDSFYGFPSLAKVDYANCKVPLGPGLILF